MDPILSQALATLITTLSTVLLLWATFTFKDRQNRDRGKHERDQDDDVER